MVFKVSASRFLMMFSRFSSDFDFSSEFWFNSDIDYGMHFRLFMGRLVELLVVNWSSTCHQKPNRKLASEKVGSEEARVRKRIWAGARTG